MMIEFSAFVEDGILRIPDAYRKKVNAKHADVAMRVKKPSRRIPKGKSVRGALAKYADKSKWPLEKHAWEMAVKEKYGIR